MRKIKNRLITLFFLITFIAKINSIPLIKRDPQLGGLLKSAGGWVKANPYKSTAIGTTAALTGMAYADYRKKLKQANQANEGALTPEMEQKFADDFATSPKVNTPVVSAPHPPIQKINPNSPAGVKVINSNQVPNPNQFNQNQNTLPKKPSTQISGGNIRTSNQNSSGNTQVLPKRVTQQPSGQQNLRVSSGIAATNPQTEKVLGEENNQLWGGEPTTNPFSPMPGLKNI